jgi:AcrR family transcriptional regulator
MRLRDDNKRRIIIKAASKLFAQQPFHRVRLEDVAVEAGIGKGTVYIYFKNKEDLYYSLVYDGLADLVQRLTHELGSSQLKFSDKIRIITRGLVDFSIGFPQLFEAMRTVGVPDASTQWDHKRQELTALIEETIRQGIANKEVTDARPDWTGLYLSAMVRAVMLYNPRDVTAEALAEHMANLVLNGVVRTIQ